jgi:fibronectin-binding autotransporter adhesin
MPLLFRHAVIACLLLVFAFTCSAANAQFYWDTNGAAAGSGNAGGLWNTGTNWSTNSGGTIATGAWVDGNQARFSAGTDGTGNLVIGITGTVNPNGVVIEEGNVSVSGNINSSSSILIQRGTGPTSLTLGGTGNSTASFIGIGNPLNIGGQTGTATLNLQDTHSLQVNGNFHLGERSGHAGNVNQSGADVTVTGNLRVGHWPNEVSTYDMSGGTLNLTATSNTEEGAGTLTVGVDGTGQFIQSDGTITAHRLHLNSRNNGLGGTSTFDMTGGELQLRAGGITGNVSGGSNFDIDLGGGTIRALESFSVNVPMELTGIGGNTSFDTNGNSINISGNLSGVGNLVKRGDGTLTLTGNNSFGSLLIQRDTGNSTVSLAGNGTTTTTFVGVGNPLNVGGQSGTATVNIQDNHNLQVNGNLFLGERSGNPGNVTQSGGSATVNGQIRVGHWSNETSTYNISDGTLNSSGGLFVGWDGVGDMSVSGTADVNATGNTIVQRNSTLRIDGTATFDTPFLSIGDQRGAGNVVQTGGTATINNVRVGHWAAGANSAYNMSGGVLNTNALEVGWDGSNNLMNLSGSADVNVNGTTLVQRNSTLDIGGNSTFDTNLFSVGAARGTGTVNIAGNAIVDASGNALVQQNSTLNIGGNSLFTTPFLSIGDQLGAGNVVQTGGTATINNVRVGHWAAGANSTYNMSGGILNTNALEVGWDGSNNLMSLSGSADVNVNGTTLVQRNSTLDIGGNSTFDTNLFSVGAARGTGTVNIAGNAIVDASGNTLVQQNSTLNIGGNSLFTTPFLSIGDQLGAGNVVQTGGTATINNVRVGHWAAGANSTYDMSGGVLSTNALEVGWDGSNNLMDLSGTADVNVNGTTLVQRNSTLDIGGNSTFDTNLFSVGAARGTGTVNIAGNAIVDASGNTLVQQNSTLNIGGNSLFTTPFLSIGDQLGAGNVVQTDGTATINNVRVGHYPVGANSTYSISGGQLNTNALEVGWDGGNSSMSLSGTGDVNVNGTTIVQRNSTLNVGGNSTFDTSFLSIGDQRGNGNVVQTGGTLTASGPAGVRVGHWGAGANSTYDMSGGILNTTTLAVGWDGGNNTMDVLGNSDVNVNGDTLVQSNSTLNIGGNAFFDTNLLSVGDTRGNGLLNVSGSAVVTTGDLIVGRTNAGTLNQTGGFINVTNVPTYVVGDASAGLVNHSNGTTNVTGDLELSRNGGSGIYNLTANGILDFGDHVGINQDPGNAASNLLINANGTFNFNGGTLIDVTTIDPTADVAGNGGVFTQNDGRFVVGRDGSQLGGNAILTTVLGDFTQSSGLLALDIVGPDTQDIDMLMADTVNLNGQLDVTANGVDVVPWNWYDAVKGDTVSVGNDFEVIGDVGLYRIILNPNGPGQILQVGVPEPGSVLLWGLLATGMAYFVRRRKVAKR